MIIFIGGSDAYKWISIVILNNWNGLQILEFHFYEFGSFALNIKKTFTVLDHFEKYPGLSNCDWKMWKLEISYLISNIAKSCGLT